MLLKKKFFLGTSLVFQWLGLWAPNAGDLGSISGQGTRSHMLPLWVDMSHWRSYILQQRLKTLFAAAKIQRSQNKYKILLKYSLFTILYKFQAYSIVAVICILYMFFCLIRYYIIILSIVPCAIQLALVSYLFYSFLAASGLRCSRWDLHCRMWAL